jgi:hypothetical protein
VASYETAATLVLVGLECTACESLLIGWMVGAPPVESPMESDLAWPAMVGVTILLSKIVIVHLVVTAAPFQVVACERTVATRSRAFADECWRSC